ncbi:hypothetical protein A9973_16665 [Achromobacter sp. UMC46]|nr:hypothetical protein [Achromobacter sp. UMC46]
MTGVAGLPNSPLPDPPLPRHVAVQAAEWFVLLHGGDATPRDEHAFEQWLSRASDHERAWQRALQVSQHAGSVPPTLAAATLRRTCGRRAAVRAMVLLMVAPPAAWLALRAVPWQHLTATHATATGEQRQVQLADGTRIWLDTRTAIDTVYDASERLVVLKEGRILVETATDSAARPFRVRTSHGTARALGTRFVVEQGDEDSRVAVLGGTVEVTPRSGADSLRLEAGQQARFDQSRIAAAGTAQPDADKWPGGILAVDDMCLDAFVAELARYRPGILRCDPEIGHLRITGAFQLRDTDAILQNLAHLLPVQARYRTRYWVTVVAAGASS